MQNCNASHFMLHLDHVCDYSPGISTISSIVNLAQKTLLRFSPAPANDHYYSHIQAKPWWRSCLLVFPIIGNIVVWLIDYSNFKKFQTHIEIASALEEAGDLCRYERPFINFQNSVYITASELLKKSHKTSANPQVAAIYLKFADLLLRHICPNPHALATRIRPDQVKHANQICPKAAKAILFALKTSKQLGPKSIETALAHYRLSLVLRTNQAHLNKAVEHSKQALAIYETYETPPAEAAWICLFLGNLYLRKPGTEGQKAIDHLKRALDIYDQLPNQEDPRPQSTPVPPACKIVTYLCLCLCRSGRVQEASTLYKERNALLKRLGREDPGDLSYSFEELGTYFFENNHYEQAISALIHAMQLKTKSISLRSSRKKRRKDRVGKKINKAIDQLGDVNKQIPYLKKLLAIYKSRPDLYAKKAEKLHYKVAKKYEELPNQSANATLHFRAGIALTVQRAPGSSEMAYHLFDLGFSLARSVSISKGITELKRALVIHQNLSPPNQYRIAEAHKALAECYRAAEHPTQAIMHYQEAISIFKQLIQTDPSEDARQHLTDCEKEMDDLTPPNEEKAPPPIPPRPLVSLTTLQKKP